MLISRIFPDSDATVARDLWESYNLYIAPRIYLILSLVILSVITRNIMLGYHYLNAIPLFISCLAAAISGFSQSRHFRLLSRTACLMFIPVFSYGYFASSPDYPPPLLIHMVIMPLLIIFLEDIKAGLAAFVISLLVCIVTLLRFNNNGDEIFLLMMTITLSDFMLFSSAIVLYFTITSLFLRHQVRSQELANSIDQRDSIKLEFFGAIREPLADLEQRLCQTAPDWKAIASLTLTMGKVLNKARDASVASKRKAFSPLQDTNQNLSETRRNAWLFQVGCGLLSAIAFGFADWFAEGIINPVSVMVMLLCLGILALDRFGTRQESVQQWSMLVFAGLITWTCVLEFQSSQSGYQILYFTILIFSSAVIFTSVYHTLLLSLLAIGLMIAWFILWPDADLTKQVFRFNILFTLCYLSVISIMFRLYLEHLLNKAVAMEHKLQAETDSRYRLLATLFHDISNPLFAIQSASEFNTFKPLGEEDRLLLCKMQQQISSMLQVSQEADELGRKGEVLSTEAVNFREMMTELQAVFAKRLSDKQLILIIEASDICIMANRLILSMSVLGNLLTNAIKFSPAGGTITVSIQAVDKGMARIRIEDEGEGVPEDVVRQLLKGQYVQSRSGTHGEAGSGHGLRLASLYLQQMGGKLKFAGGSRLDVLAPLAAQG